MRNLFRFYERYLELVLIDLAFFRIRQSNKDSQYGIFHGHPSDKEPCHAYRHFLKHHRDLLGTNLQEECNLYSHRS